jgi:hypothetical protein
LARGSAGEAALRVGHAVDREEDAGDRGKREAGWYRWRYSLVEDLELEVEVLRLLVVEELVAVLLLLLELELELEVEVELELELEVKVELEDVLLSTHSTHKSANVCQDSTTPYLLDIDELLRWHVPYNDPHFAPSRQPKTLSKLVEQVSLTSTYSHQGNKSSPADSSPCHHCSKDSPRPHSIRYRSNCSQPHTHQYVVPHNSSPLLERRSYSRRYWPSLDSIAWAMAGPDGTRLLSDNNHRESDRALLKCQNSEFV